MTTMEELGAENRILRQRLEIVEKEHAQYRTILDGMAQGVYLCHLEDLSDDRTLRGIYANPAVGVLTGLDASAIIGVMMDESFPGLRDQGLPQRYANVIRTGVMAEFEAVYGGERVIESAYAVRALPLPGNSVAVVFDNITRRKQAEHDLQLLNESLEQRLEEYAIELRQQAQVLEQISGAVVVVDTQDIIINWNRAATTIFGYRRDEAIGQHFSILHPSKECDIILSLLADRTAEQWQEEIETIAINKNGMQFPVSLSLSPLRDTHDSVVGTIGYITDISDRKRMEEEMRQSKEQLQFILEGSGDGAWDWTIPNNNVTISNRSREILGYAPDELPDAVESWTDNIHPDDIPHVQQRLNDYFSGHIDTYSLEHRMRRKDGTWSWVLSRGKASVRDDQGRPIRISGTISDVSDRKRMEGEIRIFQTLVENAPDGVCLIDTKDYRIIYVNHAYREMVQYEREELIGMLGSSLVTVDESQLQTVNQHVLDHGSWQGMIPCLCKDGTIVPTMQSIFLMSDEQRSTQLLAILTRDMRQQLAAEEERLKLQEQIIEAQQIALRELSAPLLPISDDVVILPLIGSIDSRRAQEVMEVLLEGIATYQADVAIIDITGVRVVDTQVANALIQTAQAVRLLGAQVVLTGIGPAMAHTLIGLGIDLSSIVTRGSLQSGIAYAIEMDSSARLRTR